MYQRRPPAERAVYYREMSDATFAMAERCYVLAMVEHYVHIATLWLKMAVEADQELGIKAAATPSGSPKQEDKDGWS